MALRKPPPPRSLKGKPKPPAPSAGGGKRLPPPPGTIAGQVGAPPGPSSKPGAFNPAALNLGAPEHKSPSLLGQLKNAVTALPSGIAHMGAQAYTSLNNAGNDIVGSVRNVAHPSRDPLLQSWDNTKGRFPLVEDFRASASRTGGRLADLGAFLGGSLPGTKAHEGWAQTKYAQASREGNIVGALLEDLANASIVAAGAGKVAGVAGEAGLPGAEAASSGLNTAARLGGEAAGGPAKVFTALPNVGFKVAERFGGPGSVGEAASSAGEALARKFPDLARVAPSLTAQGRDALAMLEEGKTRAAAAAQHGNIVVKRAEAAVPDLAEQQAANLIRTGQADVLSRLPEATPPETLAQWATGAGPERFQVLPEAAKLAQDYAAGRLAPDVAARLEQGGQIMREGLSAPRTEGTIGRGLNPEQLGYEPLDVPGTKALTEAGVDPGVSVDVAPARLRPAMATAQRIRGDLLQMVQDETLHPAARQAALTIAEDVPHTLSKLEAAGIDPEHLIGGGREPLTGGSTPGIPRRKVPLSEKMQRETTSTQYGFRAQAQLETKRAVEIIRDDTAQQFEAKFGKDASEVLGDTAGMTPQSVMREMAHEGFAPLGRGMTGDLVDANTKYIPSTLKAAFDKEFAPRDQGFFLSKLSRGNSAWKSWVLPISPKWHMGNIIGNTLMATVGGGLNPVELVLNLKRARDLIKSGDEAALPARLFESNVMRQEMIRLFGDASLESASLLRRSLAKSYAFNTFVDDTFRSAVYLTKIGDGLAPDIAIREALKAMGDFTNMKPWERNIAREVVPFYAWARHITGLTLRLPVEHPMRVAWTLHLADLYGDDQSALPDFLKGSLRFGDKFITANNLNPFSDPTRTPIFTPSGLGQALSPFLKVPAQMLTGVDASHGFKQTSRPLSVGKYGARAERLPGMLPLKELPGIVANQVPIWRTARDVIPVPGVQSWGAPGARYGTGEPIGQGADRLGGGEPRWQTILRSLGPFPRRVTQDEIDQAMQGK